MKTPPGVAPAAFSAALKDFSAVVGHDWVFTDDQDLIAYRDAYSPARGEPEELVASAAVAPQSVEEVQAIVRVANKYKVPLYTFSTGRNLGYGGASPNLSGCVTVDLKRMNKVLEVNEKSAFVLLEPGVSFFDLHRHFQAHNIKMLLSAPEPGWGSPVGNALDHGVSGPRGDNFGAVCGMEVVLPDGELLRTGMGGIPNPVGWQYYKYSFGPVVDGMFSQANYGIVTKMGFWLVPEPEARIAFSAISFRFDSLSPMLKTLQTLRNLRMLGAVAAAVSPLMSSPLPEVKALLATPGGGAPGEWESLAREKRIPLFIVGGNALGPRKVCDAVIQHAAAQFAKIPEVTFAADPPLVWPLDLDKIVERAKSQIGIPQLAAFYDLSVQGPPNHGHYYFAPHIPATGEALIKANRVIYEGCRRFGGQALADRWGWRAGIGFYPKAFTILMDFIVMDDPAVNQQNRQVFRDLIALVAPYGWAEYRANTLFHDTVANAYSFNSHSQRRLFETLKDAIDPNGILSPGRGNIWPKRYRERTNS